MMSLVRAEWQTADPVILWQIVSSPCNIISGVLNIGKHTKINIFQRINWQTQQSEMSIQLNWNKRKSKIKCYCLLFSSCQDWNISKVRLVQTVTATFLGIVNEILFCQQCRGNSSFIAATRQNVFSLYIVFFFLLATVYPRLQYHWDNLS